MCYGSNDQGSLQKEIPTHLPSHAVLFSPAWFILSWPQPQASLYLLAPAHLIPHCAHLTPYSPGSLEVLRLCAFVHVIPLPRRPFVLIVFLNNFCWVLAGRVDCSVHRGGQVGRAPPRIQTSPASLLHPFTPGTLLLPDGGSPRGLLSP